MIFVDLGKREQWAATKAPEPFQRQDEYVDVDGETKVRCGACGKVYGQGDSPVCKDNHGRVGAGFGDGFEPHYDVGLGKWVSGWGDVKQAMRANHLDYGPEVKASDMQARVDRIRERKERGN